MANKLTTTITEVTRIRNTVNGGPQYRFRTTSGARFPSRPDTMDSFGWVPTDLMGKPVVLTLDAKANVISIDPVKAEAAN